MTSISFVFCIQSNEDKNTQIKVVDLMGILGKILLSSSGLI